MNCYVCGNKLAKGKMQLVPSKNGTMIARHVSKCYPLGEAFKRFKKERKRKNG